ncbi:MAG: TonB-dependent receptor plug domain-containing protein [Gammaproteobacteria bacterium]
MSAFCLPPARSDSGQTAAAAEEQALFENIPSVYSASRHEQPITQAPSSVSIVTEDDIKKYGYRTLADVLSSLKGMYTSYDRIYNRIGIRGFNHPGDYNYRLLVLLDGHRINDNIVDYSAVGTDFMLDLDDVSRVELVRGPASSLYGSNAFFGVVNVITKRGRDLQGAALAGSAGSLDTRSAKFTYGDKFANGTEVYLSGSNLRSDGQYNIDVPGLGTAHHEDHLQTERTFGKLSFADFTLTGGYVNRAKQIPIPFAGGTLLNDGRTAFVDRHAYADLRYEYSFDDGTGLLARAYYDSYFFDGSYAFFPIPDVLTKDRFNGEWWGLELQLSKTLFDHHFVGGFEYRNNSQQIMRNYDTLPDVEFAHTDLNRKNWAFYVQDEYKIFDKLTLNAGFRYDKFNFLHGRLNPRAALIYTPFTDTTLKLIYGQAFRAPSVFENHYNFQGFQLGNPQLRPETIQTYELVLAQQLNTQLEASVSPYYYRANKIISAVTINDLFRYENSGPISAYGIEFELNGRWNNGWSSRFSYSLQKIEDNTLTNKAINSPTHLVKLNAVAPLWDDKIFAGLELQYTSARNAAQGSVDGYFMSNVTLFSKQLVKGLELSGTVYNLLDQHYSDPSTTDLVLDTIVQNGRTFRIRLNYEF